MQQGDPPRPRAQSVFLLLRALLEIAAGVALLDWAFHHDWSARSIWLEHTVKLLGIYLTVFDGLLLAITAASRLTGTNIHDLARHPILARTPAEFWRRHNRETGRALLYDIYLRLPFRNRSAATMAVFLINGLLHDYLVLLLTHTPTFYQTLFFLVHGAATILTARLKPTGWRAAVSWAATIGFVIITTRLFFMSVQLCVPWLQERAGR